MYNNESFDNTNVSDTTLSQEEIDTLFNKTKDYFTIQYNEIKQLKQQSSNIYQLPSNNVYQLPSNNVYQQYIQPPNNMNNSIELVPQTADNFPIDNYQYIPPSAYLDNKYNPSNYKVQGIDNLSINYGPILKNL